MHEPHQKKSGFFGLFYDASALVNDDSGGLGALALSGRGGMGTAREGLFVVGVLAALADSCSFGMDGWMGWGTGGRMYGWMCVE